MRKAGCKIRTKYEHCICVSAPEFVELHSTRASVEFPIRTKPKTFTELNKLRQVRLIEALTQVKKDS